MKSLSFADIYLYIQIVPIIDVFVTILLGSERALLNRLMTELHKLDSDILVGHNISGFDLDVLLHRAQVKNFVRICGFLSLMHSFL